MKCLPLDATVNIVTETVVVNSSTLAGGSETETDSAAETGTTTTSSSTSTTTSTTTLDSTPSNLIGLFLFQYCLLYVRIIIKVE